MRHFIIALSITFFQSELQKIVGNLLDELRELYGRLEIFSRRQVIENSRQYLLLRTDIRGTQRLVSVKYLFGEANIA